MVLSINELIQNLKPYSVPNEATAADALWIRFGTSKTRETIEYRTADGNQIVHIYLDVDGALVGVEILP